MFIALMYPPTASPVKGALERPRPMCFHESTQAFGSPSLFSEKETWRGPEKFFWRSVSMWERDRLAMVSGVGV